RARSRGGCMVDSKRCSQGIIGTSLREERLAELERQTSFSCGEESSLPLRSRLRATLLSLFNSSTFVIPALQAGGLRSSPGGTNESSSPSTRRSWTRWNGMGLKVPFSEYAWPSRSKDFKPFAHQKESMIFLLQNKRAYNFSDLGTGKTMSHLWCADFLMVNEKVKQVLVISPLSTMQSVWGSEIFFNLPHRRYKIVHGSRQDRLKALGSGADFLILNHDGVSIPEVEREIIRKINAGDIGLVIVDELTAFKKHTTNRSKAMQRISQALG